MRTETAYPWLIVAAGALITCVAFGAILALPVLLTSIAADTGWSRGGISLGVTLNFLVMGVFSVVWGYLSDRIGPRPVIMTGVALLCVGLVLSSRARSLLEFQCEYGLLIGVAAACFMAPLMSTVTQWFEQRRALAVSLVSAGVGIAPMTVSPIASWLVVEYGWRDTQFILGITCLILLMPAALLVRRPPLKTAGQGGDVLGGDFRTMTFKAFRSKAFALLALTSLASCGTHSGPIFHTVSFAVGCGLPITTAVTIYSVEGFGGLVGRIVFGLAADRYGVLKIFIGGLLLQALAAGAYSITSQLGMFYTVAFMFGMAYGGVMPLFVSLVRSYFPPQIMGTMIGTLSFASSIGMASGPAIGGWIYDTYHAYTWLYLASLIFGLCAVVTSLALPRPDVAIGVDAGLKS